MRPLALLLVLLLQPSYAESPAGNSLQASVQQLRDAVGDWDVVTEFLNPDGSVARSVPGRYRFWWVIEDRLVAGESELPEIDMKSALLFYVDSADEEIEMISVGRDGKLWVMSGALGSETRYSEPYETADGTPAQLRFTRYNVARDRFESRMEYTTDGGETWLPGNHQIFTRRP